MARSQQPLSGAPIARVSVESATPHDVQSARRLLKAQLDAARSKQSKQSKLPGLEAVGDDTGCTGRRGGPAAPGGAETAQVAVLFDGQALASQARGVSGSGRGPRWRRSARGR